MNLLCVKCRSTWTPREAAIFHHQCPWNTTWCPPLSLHSEGKHTHTHTHTHMHTPLWQSFISSSDQCTCTRQQNNRPTCNIMNPHVTNLTFPSCYFTAGSVIWHLSAALEWALAGVPSVQRRPWYSHTVCRHGQQRSTPAGLESQVQNLSQQSPTDFICCFLIRLNPSATHFTCYKQLQQERRKQIC